MHIITVNFQVKDDRIEDFLSITRRNVSATLKEPGVRRFDLVRETVTPTKFLLFEVYDRAEDHVRHKESAHYKQWAEEVEAVLVVPRSRTIYESCYPDESGWQ